MFCRVSRSAIVNLRRVQELQSVSSGEHVAILTDGQRIGISRSLREVEEKLKHV
jgi:two-component system LytT family response regulator